jgi:membrane protein YdbS with pleckstrin-like domain
MQYAVHTQIPTHLNTYTRFPNLTHPPLYPLNSNIAQQTIYLHSTHTSSRISMMTVTVVLVVVMVVVMLPMYKIRMWI